MKFDRKKDYKKTELGYIPNDWKIETLSNVSNCFVGIASSITHAYRNQGVLLVRNQNIKDGKIKLDDVLFLDEKYEQQHTSKRLKQGDILTVRTGYPGISAVVPNELINCQSFTTLITRITSPSITSDFLCYFINSSKGRSFFSGAQAGGAQKNVGAKILEQFRFPLPPLPEQKKIAEILTSVDKTIESTRKVIEQTKRVKQGLLQKLLTRGIGHTKFKKTEIGDIPKEWDFSRIKDCCIVENNKRKPINANQRRLIKGIYPYYGPTGIIDYINEYRLCGSYVLIGEDGDHFLKYKDWSMTQLVSGKFNVNNHAHIIKGTNYCSTEWIYYFFKHRNIFSFLTRQGAGRYKLNKASLLDLPLAIPKIQEQKEIVIKLTSVDKIVLAYEKELSQLQQLKKGLMQDLLSGTVRVKV